MKKNLPTLGDRLSKIEDHLLIVAALASASLASNESIQRNDRVLQLIDQQTEAALQEVFWLSSVREATLATPAPTDDEREAAQR